MVQYYLLLLSNLQLKELKAALSYFNVKVVLNFFSPNKFSHRHNLGEFTDKVRVGSAQLPLAGSDWRCLCPQIHEEDVLHDPDLGCWKVQTSGFSSRIYPHTAVLAWCFLKHLSNLRQIHEKCTFMGMTQMSY